MAKRLDNRTWLEGERRLTNAQVIALRELAKRAIHRDREGYRSGSVLIRPATIDALAREMLVTIDAQGGCCGSVAVSPSGRKLLAKIEAAS